MRLTRLAFLVLGICTLVFPQAVATGSPSPTPHRCAIADVLNCGDVDALAPAVSCHVVTGGVRCDIACLGWATASRWAEPWHVGLQLECGFVKESTGQTYNPCMTVFSSTVQVVPFLRYDLVCDEDHNSGFYGATTIPAGQCYTPTTVLWSPYWSGSVTPLVGLPSVGTVKAVVAAAPVCA